MPITNIEEKQEITKHERVDTESPQLVGKPDPSMGGLETSPWGSSLK